MYKVCKTSATNGRPSLLLFKLLLYYLALQRGCLPQLLHFLHFLTTYTSEPKILLSLFYVGSANTVSLFHLTLEIINKNTETFCSTLVIILYFAELNSKATMYYVKLSRQYLRNLLPKAPESAEWVW